MDERWTPDTGNEEKDVLTDLGNAEELAENPVRDAEFPEETGETDPAASDPVFPEEDPYAAEQETADAGQESGSADQEDGTGAPEETGFSGDAPAEKKELFDAPSSALKMPWERFLPGDDVKKETDTGAESPFESGLPDQADPVIQDGFEEGPGEVAPGEDVSGIDAEESSGSTDASYHSKYDSYRFETPAGGSGAGGPGPDIPRKERKPMNPRLKTLLTAAGIFVALIAAMIGLAYGVDRIRGGSKNGVAGAAEEKEIILGAGNSEKSSAESADSTSSSAVSEQQTADAAGQAADANEAETEPGTEAETENDAAAETDAAAEEDAAAEDDAEAENDVTAEKDAAAENESGISRAPAAAEDGTADAQIPGGEPDADQAAVTEEENGLSPVPADAINIPEVVARTMPSMVSITNVTLEEYRDIFGRAAEYENVSAGSGIIVGMTEQDYLIATNYHVVEGSNEITVAFADNSTAEGTLKGSDADYDLAIVAVSADSLSEETKKAVSVITVGNSDDVLVGEDVVAIGNSLGYGQSVSRGIVSAVNRELADPDGTVRTMIQTDASINPGNSGGALLNMRGELIGINEAKAVDESIEGVGYAIPMSIAEPILEKLGSRETRTKVEAENSGYLGVTVMTVPSASSFRGMPAGVYVSTVVEKGPADIAGIKVGDIITTVDGNAIKGNDDLLEQLSYFAAGETVGMTVSRLNDEQNAFTKVHVDVTLGNKADVFGEEGGPSGAGQQPLPDSAQGGTDSSENGDFGGYYGGLFDDSEGFPGDKGGR
ncbi:MAG: trypsin-like peptidase domain-containing protein [Lachnospiraceae bacterium]|nr:trypsin-like peptidase domain-containing protein [Lachnospiraceae bacterium]